MAVTSARRVGDAGEECVARYLRQCGYEILARNWRSGRYELDIIACKADVIHIVEVKSRKRFGVTAPEQALSPTKYAALLRAIELYVEESGTDAEIQLDLAAVEYDETGLDIRFHEDVRQY